MNGKQSVDCRENIIKTVKRIDKYILIFYIFALFFPDNFEIIFLGDENDSPSDGLQLALFSIKSVRNSFPSWIQVVVANEM